jgi:hypothetical protein
VVLTSLLPAAFDGFAHPHSEPHANRIASPHMHEEPA